MARRFIIDLTDMWVDIGDFQSPQKMPGAEIKMEFGNIYDPRLIKKEDTRMTAYVFERDNAKFFQTLHPFSPYS